MIVSHTGRRVCWNSLPYRLTTNLIQKKGYQCALTHDPSNVDMTPVYDTLHAIPSRASLPPLVLLAVTSFTRSRLPAVYIVQWPLYSIPVHIKILCTLSWLPFLVYPVCTTNVRTFRNAGRVIQATRLANIFSTASSSRMYIHCTLLTSNENTWIYLESTTLQPTERHLTHT